MLKRKKKNSGPAVSEVGYIKMSQRLPKLCSGDTAYSSVYNKPFRNKLQHYKFMHRDGYVLTN